MLAMQTKKAAIYHDGCRFGDIYLYCQPICDISMSFFICPNHDQLTTLIQRGKTQDGHQTSRKKGNKYIM